jgi:hypothetical protein
MVLTSLALMNKKMDQCILLHSKTTLAELASDSICLEGLPSLPVQTIEQLKNLEEALTNHVVKSNFVSSLHCILALRTHFKLITLDADKTDCTLWWKNSTVGCYKNWL